MCDAASKADIRALLTRTKISSTTDARCINKMVRMAMSKFGNLAILLAIYMALSAMITSCYIAINVLVSHYVENETYVEILIFMFSVATIYYAACFVLRKKINFFQRIYFSVSEFRDNNNLLIMIFSFLFVFIIGIGLFVPFSIYSLLFGGRDIWVNMDYVLAIIGVAIVIERINYRIKKFSRSSGDSGPAEEP